MCLGRTIAGSQRSPPTKRKGRNQSRRRQSSRGHPPSQCSIDSGAARVVAVEGGWPPQHRLGRDMGPSGVVDRFDSLTASRDTDKMDKGNRSRKPRRRRRHTGIGMRAQVVRDPPLLARETKAVPVFCLSTLARDIIGWALWSAPHHDQANMGSIKASKLLGGRPNARQCDLTGASTWIPPPHGGTREAVDTRLRPSGPTRGATPVGMHETLLALPSDV